MKRTNERGIALIVTVLVLLLTAGLVAAALSAAQTALRTTNADYQDARAFYAADGAVEAALAEFVDPKMAIGGYEIGTWETLSDRLWIRTSTERIDNIASSGGTYRIRGSALAGAEPFSAADVELIVEIRGTFKNIPGPGAIWAPGGFIKNGGSGQITGYPDGSCPGDTVAGLVVADSSYIVENDSIWIEGEPRILVAADPPFTWDDVEAIEPTLTMDDETGWPTDPAIWETDPWPVVRINGPASLGPSMSGKGILIVEGDLTTNGSWSWEGVLMIGGGWTSNGNNTMRGAAFVGMITGDPITVGNGEKTFVFDACAIEGARKATGEKETVVTSWRQSYQ